MCYVDESNAGSKTKGRRVLSNINKYCITVPTIVIGYTAMIAALYVSIIMYHRNDSSATED